jgi:hypothetical protein
MSLQIDKANGLDFKRILIPNEETLSVLASKVREKCLIITNKIDVLSEQTIMTIL